ncbi:MAG: VIT family protein [Alphaproteobacteria bacterium]|nr:VIT family protein [Alphaproteobacteria bacterium]
MTIPSAEDHRVGRSNWLRAAVLGANDGIISTASLIVGVASASSTHTEIITAGIAGMIAGAMSMAAGEYVSVSSQTDIEQADIARETRELKEDWDFEVEELAQIYMARGLEQKLAREVALQLMKKDALGAHARDELGISELTTPRPVQAALASAAAFSIGAIFPILTTIIASIQFLVPIMFVATLFFLAALGCTGARAGGANMFNATIRVAFWGALAMTVTAGVGEIIGKAI